MRRVYGKRVGWKCEECGRSFYKGWVLEFHHIIPTHAGGADTFENMKCLCMLHHYEAHLTLNLKKQDHPASAGLILARLRKTGGRTYKWRKKNGWI